MQVAFVAAGFEEGQRLHALRYTAAVRLYERNFAFANIAEQTGHRMAAMAQKYCEKRREVKQRELVFDGFDDAFDDLVGEAFSCTGDAASPRSGAARGSRGSTSPAAASAPAGSGRRAGS
jgi:hypothetical protein